MRRTIYGRYLDDRARKGGFYHVFRDYIRAMTLEEANLVLHIANVGRAKSDAEGFVLCTPRFQADGLGLSRPDQDRILGSLSERGIIEVQVQDGRRYVRIDLDRIEELIESAGPGPYIPPSKKPRGFGF